MSDNVVGTSYIQSILDDIKHRVGPSVDYDHFDTDILDAINTAFAILQQRGAKEFEVVDNTTTWSDYSDDKTLIGLVRTYVYNKVRLIFDPPSSSFVLSAMEKQNEELEFRISIIVDDQTGGY